MKHFITLLLGMLLVLPLNGYAQQSVRGDVNGSGSVDIDDVNAVINIMVHKADPTAGADVNGDSAVDIDDLNVVINVMLGKDGDGSDGDWVDLGLPSGTLWATRNIGAASPEDCGYYFAWGETTTKAVYNWDTYKWYKEGYNAEGSWDSGFTKYCKHSHYGFDDFVDNKTELDLADDAAANWGGGARMPSNGQIKELLNNCSWQWTQRNGVNGRLGTGPNGNTIFLPAAGYRWEGSLDAVGDYGGYWSRTLYAEYAGNACSLHFISDFAFLDYYDYRYYGHTIRAVRVP